LDQRGRNQDTMDETTVYVWSLLGTVLGTLLMAAALLWASKKVIQQVGSLWRVLRGHQDEVLRGVDEPGDPFIRRLEAITTIPGEVWAAFLPAFLRALAQELDTLLETTAEAETLAAYFDDSTQTGR
jgi:hypothetical protein